MQNTSNIYRLTSPTRVRSPLHHTYSDEGGFRIFSTHEYVNNGMPMDISRVFIDSYADGYLVSASILDSSSDFYEILLSESFKHLNDAKTLATRIAEMLLDNYPHMKDEIQRKCKTLQYSTLNVGESLKISFDTGFKSMTSAVGDE